MLARPGRPVAGFDPRPSSSATDTAQPIIARSLTCFARARGPIGAFKHRSLDKHAKALSHGASRERARARAARDHRAIPTHVCVHVPPVPARDSEIFNTPVAHRASPAPQVTQSMTAGRLGWWMRHRCLIFFRVALSGVVVLDERHS